MGLGESVRFEPGEVDNDAYLARGMAALCEVYVNDAFGVCHRRHASVCAITEHAACARAGPLLLTELDHLGRLLHNPRRPLVAVIGGAKLESKLGTLHSLLPKVDRLAVGGGVATSLLAALGHGVGRSPVGAQQAARELLAKAPPGRLLLPRDLVCARAPTAQAQTTVRSVDAVAPQEAIFDLGPASSEHLRRVLAEAGTILWSGPMGMFELPPFAEGTRRLAEAVAASAAYSVAGGGETLAALARYAGADAVSYRSTGGGAMMTLLEQGTLPAVESLRHAAAHAEAATAPVGAPGP